MRNQVINSVLDEKLIVIVRGVPSDKLLPLAEAMYNGGVRLKKTVDLGLVSIPGSLTPSEAQLAHRSGADFKNSSR